MDQAKNVEGGIFILELGDSGMALIGTSFSPILGNVSLLMTIKAKEFQQSLHIHFWIRFSWWWRMSQMVFVGNGILSFISWNNPGFYLRYKIWGIRSTPISGHMIRRINIYWILSMGVFRNDDIHLIHDVIKSFVKDLVFKHEKLLVILLATT